MKKIFHFTALIFLLGGTALHAQSKMTISGYVIDKETQKPLPYTNIAVINTMRGTASNSEGKFQIVLDSSSYLINISYIGYENKTLAVHQTEKSILVELGPKPIHFDAVVVYPDQSTWEERFISRAIEEKKRFRDALKYYTAHAYSKTSFLSSQSNDLFAMIEAVSDISYQQPDLYKEIVLSLQMPPYMKNLPYQAVSINQELDLYNEKVKVKSFSMPSPLSDNALEDYTFKRNRQFLSGQDTILQMDFRPKSSRKPLLAGELFFNKNSYQLVEARLRGNGSVRDEMVDSLSLLIKYKTDSLFVLPIFSQIKMKMNFLGYSYSYVQETSYVNHIINNPLQKPYIDIHRRVSVEPNLTYDVGLKRESMFRMPLTEEEVDYQNVVDRVFYKAPLYRRIFLFLFCDLLPLSFDQPASIGPIKVSKLSNWYHFNKAEGHYLGAEYQFLNNAFSSLYAAGGYSFTQKTAYYDLKSRYRGLEIQIKNHIQNLGGFDYNQTGTTAEALLAHRDDLHYYHSKQYSVSQTTDILHKFQTRLGVCIEEREPVFHTTQYSLFKKDRTYVSNYGIRHDYNNRFVIELNYLGNGDFANNRPILYHGNPFLNVSVGYYLQNSAILKASEDRAIYHIKIHRFQPIFNPVAVDFKCIWHQQDRSKFLQEYNFLSRMGTIFENENDLGFYSINNYDFVVKDYVKLQGEATLFRFPQLYTLRMSFAGLMTYLKPYGKPELPSNDFKPLDKPFWEYGIAIKGISILDLYLVANNLNKRHFNFLFRMAF